MSNPNRVTLELCLSNSIGSRYCDPTVKETIEVAEAEAEQMLKTPLENGFFYRRQDSLGQWDFLTHALPREGRRRER